MVSRDRPFPCWCFLAVVVHLSQLYHRLLRILKLHYHVRTSVLAIHEDRIFFSFLGSSVVLLLRLTAPFWSYLVNAKGKCSERLFIEISSGNRAIGTKTKKKKKIKQKLFDSIMNNFWFWCRLLWSWGDFAALHFWVNQLFH